MIKKLTILTFVVCLSAYSLPAFAAFSQGDWMFRKDVILPELQEKAYVQVKLDKEVAGVGNYFRDVRVITGGSEEVPYQLIVEDATSENVYVDTSIINQSVDSKGQRMFILDLGKSGVFHSRVDISSTMSNFKRQVSVYSADILLGHSDAGWNLLSDDGSIFKFTDKSVNFSAGRGVINYPKSTSRYLRVVIGAGEEGPVSVSRARVYNYGISGAKEEDFLLTTEIEENKDDKATEIIIDFGTEGIATKKIQLDTRDMNFSRRVVIQASNNKRNWRRVGDGYIFKLSTPSFVGENLSIQYPELTSRYLRVVVFNGDNKPVDFEGGVVSTGVIRTIVFEAEKGRDYSLFFGNKNASSPQYDLARFFKYFETEGFLQATLGDKKESDSYEAPLEPIVPFTERYPNLLNVMLAILVLFLGAGVFLYIKKYKKTDNQINS